MTFNAQDLTVVGLYSWTYQYKEASATKRTPEIKAARFLSFLRQPEPLVEGQAAQADHLLTAWKGTIAKLRINEKVKQLSAMPLDLDSEAGTLVGDQDKSKTILTATLE